MGETARFQQPPAEKKHTRVKAEHRYPVYDLANSLAVADAVRNKGGGATTPPHLATFLGYSSTTSGAFVTRIAAARLFGLIENSGQYIQPTPLATQILAPEHPGVDDVVGRISAFKSVPLYRTLYERYKTGPLPPEMGMRNALETQYGIPRDRAQIAFRVFMDSADQAGFFNARGGVRTHLVEPILPPGFGAPTSEEDEWGAPTIEGTPSQIATPEFAIDTRGDLNTALKRALVQKMAQVDANDIDKIKEYILLIRQLDEPTPSKEHKENAEGGESRE